MHSGTTKGRRRLIKDRSGAARLGPAGPGMAVQAWCNLDGGAAVVR